MVPKFAYPMTLLLLFMAWLMPSLGLALALFGGLYVLVDSRSRIATSLPRSLLWSGAVILGYLMARLVWIDLEDRRLGTDSIVPAALIGLLAARFFRNRRDRSVVRSSGSMDGVSMPGTSTRRRIPRDVGAGVTGASAGVAGAMLGHSMADQFGADQFGSDPIGLGTGIPYDDRSSVNGLSATQSSWDTGLPGGTQDLQSAEDAFQGSAALEDDLQALTTLHDDPMQDPFSDINPANGLPIVGGVDIEGNPYGFDSHGHDFDSFGSGISDDWHDY